MTSTPPPAHDAADADAVTTDAIAPDSPAPDPLAPDPAHNAPMQRVCFQLQVKPERFAEYRDRHAAVWPDMLDALKATGWNNYSLFVRDDGLLIGYFETPSLEAAKAGMAAQAVNARWQAEMSEFFLDLDLPPDEGFLRLTEVFHLEDQLAAPPPPKPHAPLRNSGTFPQFRTNSADSPGDRPEFAKTS